MNALISQFAQIKQTDNPKTRTLSNFLEDIKSGAWQDLVLPYRADSLKMPDAELKKKYAPKFPYVTISGEFERRSNDGLKTHSGFICIDVDDVNPSQVKAMFIDQNTGEIIDNYVYACFASRGDNGVAILFKINPKRHLDSFNGLAEYLFTKYGLVVDQACKDISRARFVSYDPEMYLNEHSEKFAIYPKPEPRAAQKLQKVVFVQSDFDDIIREIESRRVDITADSYYNFLRIAFALVDKLGEAGRSYFHAVCQFSSKYNYGRADKQYTVCLKRGGQGVTIASFYYFAKQMGIRTMSVDTQTVIQSAIQAKRMHRGSPSKVLQEAKGIDPKFSEPIINQVFEQNIDEDVADSIIDELELFLQTNYDFKLNSITRKIEVDGKELDKRYTNTIFLQAKKIMDKLSFELFERVIYSGFTTEYNPLVEYLESIKGRKSKDNILKVANCIHGDYDPAQTNIFIKRWLLAIISSIYGNPKPLMLVLSGSAQGTGKTEFFRRILPEPLKKYYAESKLDAGKDDDILMTSKLLILDDEMSGKSKKESSKFKDLTSKHIFSLREPYGHHNVDLKRLAILCGTTNEQEILNDMTGNRRILPVHVNHINHTGFNAIDKDDLFAEALHLYLSGETADLNEDERFLLNEVSEKHQESIIELDLLNKYFVPSIKGRGGHFYTSTDIKVIIEKFSMQKLNINKLGQSLRKLGFVKTYNTEVRQQGYYAQRTSVSEEKPNNNYPF